MKMKNLFSRLRSRPSKRRARDWSSNWTERDWADLPTHHPRREDDAL